MDTKYPPPTGYYSDIVPIIRHRMQPFKAGIRLARPLINSYLCPVINIKFLECDQVFEAVLDTGAYNSHIRTDALRQIQPEYVGQVIGQHPVYGEQSANGFDQKFSIEGNHFIFQEVFGQMFTNYQFPVILGNIFLSRCEFFSVDYLKNEFVLIL